MTTPKLILAVLAALVVLGAAGLAVTLALWSGGDGKPTVTTTASSPR